MFFYLHNIITITLLSRLLAFSLNDLSMFAGFVLHFLTVIPTRCYWLCPRWLGLKCLESFFGLPILSPPSLIMDKKEEIHECQFLKKP